jgi:hypothetical protein
MGFPVITGALLTCPFGLAPSTLSVLPVAMVNMENKPAATIMDNIPMVNIAPFGMCTSLANPVTAAQTAAALGVLTPGACLPVIPAPWAPGSPTVLIGNKPALNNASMCNCAYGGVITISFAGATTEMIP